MAFGDSLNNKGGDNSAARVSPYLPLRPGEYTIRLLDDEETPYWRYWLMVNVNGQRQGRSIIVGRNNPVKAWMDEIGKEDPKYQSVSRRFVMNVLDRTNVIIVDGRPVYANENGKYLVDNKEVTGVAVPHNQVRIFEFGSQVLESLVALQGRMRSRTDRSRTIGILETDLLLYVTGEKTNKRIQALQGFDEDVLTDELSSLRRYDLSKMTQPMPNEQVQELLDGKDFNEVYQSLGWNGDYPLL